MIGSRTTPAARINPVDFMISAAIKKGKSEGTTIYAHNLRPLSAAFTIVSDIRIRQIIKAITDAGTTNALI
jgi:lysylphosphatidylglycerol synthetase-like protein (DUF2156 family)